MLLVIAIVGGAIFMTVQNSARVQTVSGLTNADVQVDDFGVNTDNELQMELRAATSEQVENVNVSIIDSESSQTVYSCSQHNIPVADTETVQIEGVKNSENTNTYEIEIEYDSGGLEGLTETGSITGRISLNSSLSCGSDDGSINAILTTGGTIPTIELQNTLRVGTEGEDGCLGDLCNKINPGDDGDPVQVSGDNMTGTLTVENILNTDNCIVTEGKEGGACKLETTSDSGELTETNNIMYGQLSTPTLKTRQNTCVGEKC